MEAYNLDPIFEYGMSPDEGTAYEIGLMWMEMSNKVFPEIRNLARFPKKGDPRKSSLFRYAHTMIQKTRGILDPKDYKLYITAQLQMLKSIEINGSMHPHITPTILLGDKAWTRWRMWKSKFDNMNQSKKSQDVVPVNSGKFDEAKASLDRTKKFLDSKFEHTEENFKLNAHNMKRWVSLTQVCGYYAAISPWVAKYCNLGDIDLEYYKTKDQTITDYFDSLFKESSS